MAEFTGKNLALSFIYSGGTIDLAPDFRTFSKAPSIGMVDASAGSDADRTYLTTLKDGTYSWGAVVQEIGTAIRTALVEGTGGTLEIGEEGTAIGNPKETVPVISMGAQYNIPYDNVVEISCQFQKNGARTEAVYA